MLQQVQLCFPQYRLIITALRQTLLKKHQLEMYDVAVLQIEKESNQFVKSMLSYVS